MLLRGNDRWDVSVSECDALRHDGTTDSGRELFGSGTRLDAKTRARNGFLALEPLDTDRNGRIDARFSELVLWSDHDGDKRGTLADGPALDA
ncbi:MAG: hypothetical protein KUG77_29150 [Nannocystaceae bacterium]|nr:hypothetical protein [Nannocystaceae bacterium]